MRQRYARSQGNCRDSVFTWGYRQTPHGAFQMPTNELHDDLQTLRYGSRRNDEPA